MKTDDIMSGIWAARSRRELSIHMDNVETAIDMGECSYNLSDQLAFGAAIIEVIANNFERMLH